MLKWGREGDGHREKKGAKRGAVGGDGAWRRKLKKISMEGDGYREKKGAKKGKQAGGWVQR